MASATILPATERQPPAGLFLRVLLPLFLLLVLLITVGGSVYCGLVYIFATSQISDTLETEFVLRRLELPIHLPQGAAFHLSSASISWLVLLSGFLLVTLGYIGFKYARDARAGSWPRANFLAAFRLIGLLGFIFLFLYVVEVMEFVTQSLGRRTWSLLAVLLPMLAVLYVAGQFIRERVGCGWRHALLCGAARVTVYTFLGTLLVLRTQATAPMNSLELSGMWWLAVLVPVLLASIAYVVWMYLHDSVSLGWAWATLLATLRITAYLVLALVFLLPAWQNWDKTETRSRVIVLPDVSASTNSRDDPPIEGMPIEKLPTRQDKVIDFLSSDAIAFLQRLQEKNPVAVYRFGGRLDEDFKLFDGSQQWAGSDWDLWLKPNAKETISDDLNPQEREKAQKRLDLHQQLIGGTSLADSLAAVLNRESNNMLQGIIVFSDGRSTQPSDQVLQDVRARARKAKVPIFTVAVGEHRQPVSIRITDLQAPEQARPDDKFPIRIEVDGEGLPDQEITVSLDVTAPSGETRTLEKPLKFSPGSGGPPHGQTEFEIDAALFGSTKDAKKPELDEGEWSFRARIPRDKREVFLEKEHKSDKATVQVVKKPLRVLLFAGAATRDYQFVRTQFVREADARRAEVSICLQLLRDGVVQDVSPDRLLRHFPDRFQAEDGPQVRAEEKYYNLAQYDLIVAFDPDWSQLEPAQLALLERWVGSHAGGLILVGGPVNTYQLARPGNRDRLKPVIDLFPVVLQDSRLQGLSAERTTSDPWRLNFPGATSELEFLKLEDESKDQMAGWEEFFLGREKLAGGVATVQRGFYNYYPVDSVKPSSTVVATLADPRAHLRDGREQPYLVTMPYGSGKVVYISSGETWRLRTYREVFFERFWTKLGRYAGSGTLTRLSNRGVIVMGQEFTAGQFARLEAQLFGRDMQALSKNAIPKVYFRQSPPDAKMPASVELQPKPGAPNDWNGWFAGRFRVPTPGEYRIELQIPDTGDVLPRRFLVKESNPELDNTRPDFGSLYQLASEATDVLPRMPEGQARSELLRGLETTAARLAPMAEEKPADEGRRNPQPAKAEAKDGRVGPKLFFDLRTARLIPACMITDVKLHRNRGAFEDLWDRGFTLLEPGSHRALGRPFVTETPVQMSYALLVVVVLLSLEWLARKLLRLA